MCTEDSGVVDKHVDAAFARFDILSATRDRLIVADVDGHESSAEATRCASTTLGIAGTDDDGPAELDEASSNFVEKDLYPLR